MALKRLGYTDAPHPQYALGSRTSRLAQFQRSNASNLSEEAADDHARDRGLLDIGLRTSGSGHVSSLRRRKVR